MLASVQSHGLRFSTPRGMAMGRRSTHTPQQLRELILDAAQEIIEVHGLGRPFCARDRAAHRLFAGHHLQHVREPRRRGAPRRGARARRARPAPAGLLQGRGNADGRVGRLAQAYLAFTHEKPRLWNLLFEHHMPAGADLPAWYQQKLEGLMGRVEEALAPLVSAGPGGRTPARRRACSGPACTASPRYRPPTSCPW